MISKAPMPSAPRRSRWEGGGAEVGEVQRRGRPVHLPADDAEEHGAENAKQHRGLDAQGLQQGDEHDAEGGQAQGLVRAGCRG